MALAGPAVAAPGQADVLFAFDTTPTMGPSIEDAKKNAQEIVAGLRGTFPDLNVGVVEFRDLNYDDASPEPPAPGGVDDGEHDYYMRQAMTADGALFDAALAKLKVVPGDMTWRPNAPESYNLVFNQSVNDTNIAWRAGTQQFVYVIGDSEPYGAGGVNAPAGAVTTGFNRCDDNAPDPHVDAVTGLPIYNTRKELDGMKAAGRKLIMVLQTAAVPVGQVRDDLFACYSAMAEYTGGSAVAYPVATTPAGGTTTPGGGAAPGGGGVPDVGASSPGAPSLVQPIVSAVQNSLAKLTAKAAKKAYAPGSTALLSVTFTNPNAYAVRLATIKVGLPKGTFLYVKKSSGGATLKDPARAGRVLTWKVGKAVKAKGTVTLRFRIVLPAKVGRYGFTSSATALLPNSGGATITSSLKAPASVVVRRTTG